jgi:hypothetical protein
MGDMSDALSRARADAQALRQKIEAATAKDRETASSDLQEAGAKAQELAVRLKTLAESQRNDARQYLKSAAVQLEDAGKHGAALAHRTPSQIIDTNRCMLGKVRESIQNIGRAIASLR